MASAALSQKQRKLEQLYSNVLRDRTTEQWANFQQHANAAKQLSVPHLQELLLIEQRKEEEKYTEMRDLVNNSQFQDNPVLRFFSADIYAHTDAEPQAILELEKAIPALEPFQIEKCGEITENGANIQYSPIFSSIYFQAKLLRLVLILKRRGLDENQRSELISEMESVCNLLWSNKKIFEQFDTLSLFRVQHLMLSLPNQYIRAAEYVKALQFLRKFFLPDGENAHVIPVQPIAKTEALSALGRLLVRHMTDHKYSKSEGLKFNENEQLDALKRLDQNTPRLARSKSTPKQIGSTRTLQESDINIVAQDWIEEALLTLLSLERITSPSVKYNYKLIRSGCDHSGGTATSRETAYDKSIAALYDHLTTLLSEQKKYNELLSIVERGLSRYSEDIHFWYQFALVLMKSKKYYRALKVLDEVISLDPTDANSYLLASKICLNYLSDKTSDALEYAKKAVELKGFHSMRSYHSLGLSYGALAKESNSRTERRAYQEKALDAFKGAYELDSQDYLLCYDMALQYADNRDLGKAFTYVKKAISLNGRFVDAWVLLTLLFTSEKDYASAAKTIKVALADNPKNIKLLVVNARLQELTETPIQVRRAYNRLIKALNGYKNGEPTKPSAFKETTEDSAPEASSKFKLQKRAIKTAQIYLVIAEAFRRLGSESRLDSDDEEYIQDGLQKVQAAKEILGKLIIEHSQEHIDTSTIILTVPQVGDKIQEGGGNIYIEAFDSFVSDSHRTPVASNSNFFKTLQKVCANVRFTEGRFCEETGSDSPVKKYESALVCNANHPETLVRMGIIMAQEHKLMLARSHLHNAVRVDACSHEAWYHLGLVMKEMGDLAGASECFMASLKLEQTSPLVDFDKILKR